MKTQMRFQKILVIISLVLAAVCFVYALIFCSGILTQMYQLVDCSEITSAGYEGVITDLHDKAQAFSDTFLILGIILILVMVVPFIMGNQSRRNYYITNYIATGIVVVFTLVYAILLVVNVADVAQTLANIDYQNWIFSPRGYDDVDIAGLYNDVYPSLSAKFGDWSESTWMFGMGYALFALLIVDVAAYVLNLVWKIKLMQGEKKLLAAGLAKEVA